MFGGWCALTVIFVTNELDELKSNPSPNFLHFYSCYYELGKAELQDRNE